MEYKINCNGESSVSLYDELEEPLSKLDNFSGQTEFGVFQCGTIDSIKKTPDVEVSIDNGRCLCGAITYKVSGTPKAARLMGGVMRQIKKTRVEKYYANKHRQLI